MAAAARACRIDVSQQNKECWLAMWAYAGLLDDLIDEQPPERISAAYNLYEQLISGNIPKVSNMPAWANPDLVQHAQLFEKTLVGLDDRPRTAAMQIALCSRLKLLATKPREYAAICRLEALYCADIVVAILPKPERARGRKKFARWLRNFMKLLSCRDSLADLEEDFKVGRTQLASSWQAKVWLGSSALSAAILLGVHWNVTFQALSAMRRA